MEPIRINLKEEAGFDRVQEPIRLGIPVPKGKLVPRGALPSFRITKLTGAESGPEPICQTTPLSHWPDGSIRWLKVNFLADLSAGQTETFELTRLGHHAKQSSSPLLAELQDDHWHINTGEIRFVLPRTELKWFAKPASGISIPHEIRLTDENNRLCSAVSDVGWDITESGPACITLESRGKWCSDDETLLARFHCVLRFYANSDTAELDVCIHNSRRALHPGGLWDLGDPGSIYFKALTVHVTNPASDSTCMNPEPGEPPLTGDVAEGLYLYQDSSGGDQWHSRNHVNARGEVTTRFRGYKVRSGEKTLATGKRASPIVGLTSPGQTVQATMRQFWQNFPSALGVQHQELLIGLFPPEAADPYELQGGERKTQTVYLSYNSSPEALLWTRAPIVPTLDPKHYERALAFPWFKAYAPRRPLDDLIQQGVAGRDNFFAKREKIDEYGWRNFGDIFADHETLYQKEDENPLISHYNNQYDAIYGFARQFALTGDKRWFELMDDAAKHIVDIDIYHTDEDRLEYNNGLFWHTDHYLDAQTATHRTFTRHNSNSSTQGQTGGGPAEEHCYTTGLLYHHFLTGSSSSRQAVLDLASWITNLHEGSGTFLEQLLRIKRFDVPKIKSLLAGRNPTNHTYPFNRGTGNYLNTLLDAHLLEPQKGWLEQAEKVIFGTINPNDRIDDRNLLTAETGWSYLVFLAAISRFLLIKEEHGAYDGAHQFSVDSFRHYTRWMLANEQRFLSRPDELEFPNDTWVAQDVRKAILFYQAPHWDPELADQYTTRANEFFDYVVETLEESPEQTLARVQIILLQNYGAHSAKEMSQVEISHFNESLNNTVHTPFLTWPALVRRIVGRLGKGLIGFSLDREQNWLSTRLKR